MKKILAVTLAIALTLGAAAPAHAGRDDIGLIAGALGGGVIGHQFGKGKGNTWATAIGAVTGAVVGQSIGTSLDRGERAYRNQRSGYWGNSNSYYQSAPVYYSAPAPQVYYVSPSYETRVRTYEVRPAPVNFQTYDNSLNSGRYCREYQAPVTVGGRTQGSYGTACMQPDGSWEVVR